MTHAAIAADLAEALDVQSGLTAQIALDDIVVDHVTELLLLGVSQILHAGVRVDPGLFQDVLRALAANAIDIGQADFNALILGQVNTGQYCAIAF